MKRNGLGQTAFDPSVGCSAHAADVWALLDDLGVTDTYHRHLRWRFPPESAVDRIPGFADSTIEEATRGSFARDHDTGPDGLRQAFEFYRESPISDLSSVTREPGYLNREQLISRYRERMDLNLDALPWYQTLALWKASIFCEALYARWLNGERPGDAGFGPSLEAGVPRLLEAARL